MYSATVDNEWRELESERRSVYRARPNAGTVTMNANCCKHLNSNILMQYILVQSLDFIMGDIKLKT